MKTSSYGNDDPALVARLMSKGSQLKTNVFPDPHEILRAAPYRQCHAHYRTTEFDFHQEVRIIALGQYTFFFFCRQAQNGVLSQIMSHNPCRKLSAPKRRVTPFGPEVTDCHFITDSVMSTASQNWLLRMQSALPPTLLSSSSFRRDDTAQINFYKISLIRQICS